MMTGRHSRQAWVGSAGAHGVELSMGNDREALLSLVKSVEVPHLSFFLIGEDFAALHVGIRGVGERAVV